MYAERGFKKIIIAMFYSKDTTTTKEPTEEDDSVSLLTGEQKREYQLDLKRSLLRERRKKQGSIFGFIKNLFK